MKKLTRTQRYPHFISLPKGSVSPTRSIHKRFDIESQGSVLNTWEGAPNMLRSSKPFSIKVQVGKKIKYLTSRTK